MSDAQKLDTLDTATKNSITGHGIWLKPRSPMSHSPHV